ncbi:MAG TPA: ABC transporter permease [Candidatus Limnocylindrales bacterium]
MKTLRDTWLIFDRSVRLTLRNPTWLFIGLMQPIMFLVLFGPLLDRIAQGPGFPAGGAWNVFVPGLLIQLSMFVGFAGFGLIAEQRAGVVERMRVTPLSRAAMLLGRSLRDVVFLLCQAVVLIAVSIPLGLRPDLPAIALTLGLLVLIGLALAPTSYALGLWLKSEDAFAPLLNSITIPLLLLSGILLPMSLAPDWLQTVASFNPFAHAVDAARAAFTGNFGDPEIPIGIGVMAALATVAVWVGARAFSRAAS